MQDFPVNALTVAAIISFAAVLRPFPSLKLPTRKRAFVVFLVSCVLVSWARSSQIDDEEEVLSPEEQVKEALIDSFLAIRGEKLGTEEFYLMRKKYERYGELENVKTRVKPPHYKIGYFNGLDVSYVFNVDTDKILFTGKGKSAAEYVKKEVEKGFSRWDGSHRELTKEIKSLMNDPDSYEHIDTGYLTFKKYIEVETKFRGTNAYGAVVQDKVRARVDYNGEVLEITSLRGPTLNSEEFGSK